MNTLTSRDAGELALARLDDDGAPPAVTRPQINDSQDHHAIRRGRTGKVAGSQAETSDISRSTANPIVGHAPAGEAVATVIPRGSAGMVDVPAGDAANVPAAIPAGPPSSRVSFDDTRDRCGAAGGRWWPHSRNALTELPALICGAGLPARHQSAAAVHPPRRLGRHPAPAHHR
jgi:hypothetical protein